MWVFTLCALQGSNIYNCLQFQLLQDSNIHNSLQFQLLPLLKHQSPDPGVAIPVLHLGRSIWLPGPHLWAGTGTACLGCSIWTGPAPELGAVKQVVWVWVRNSRIMNLLLQGDNEGLGVETCPLGKGHWSTWVWQKWAKGDVEREILGRKRETEKIFKTGRRNKCENWRQKV